MPSASSCAAAEANSRTVAGTMFASVARRPCAASDHSIEWSAYRVDARREAADDELLDLRRALVETVHARVTPKPLHRELVAEAVSAVDLDRVVGRALRDLARIELGDARLARARHTLVLQMTGTPHEEPRGLGLDDHVRDHLLHELVARDRLPERLSLQRVGDGCVDRGLRLTDGAGGDGVSPRVERAHRDLEALADLTEPHAVGDAHVLEDELARVRRAKTELVVQAGAPVRALLAIEQERRDPF